jgi:hypothetical protein
MVISAFDGKVFLLISLLIAREIFLRDSILLFDVSLAHAEFAIAMTQAKVID